MKIVSWNIRFGGVGRCSGIASELVRHDPDVIVISEYQQDTSTPLMQALADAGWRHQLVSTPPLKFGGLAVASKSLLELRERSEAMQVFQHRYLPVGIPAHNVELRTVYAPLHKDPFADFWNGMLTDLKTDVDGPVLVIGDFNAGEPNVDSPASDVFCSSYFAQLPSCGYQDLWRATKGREAREYTWLGPVNPYRLDHAFGTLNLGERVTSCRYDHSVRVSRLSDHSLLSVEIR